MSVGEYVTTKFTWLLDDVEATGIVRLYDDGTGGLRPDDADALDLELDPNYAHMVAGSRGNNPLPWLPDGTLASLHLETYVPIASQVNHIATSSAGKPGDQRFKVKLPDGTTRDLADGDHVRVRGRWVIDHHPERCSTFNRCRNRGWLRVGQTHMELHPFRWDDIQLVYDTAPSGFGSLVLSLAAPVHEEQYLGAWKWFANELAGVSGHVFDDGSNFHQTMSAVVRVSAPDLPAAWAEVHRELQFDEEIRQIGLNLQPSQLRRIVADATGITVTATVTAISPRPGERPTINDPANGRSVFQARYRAWWDLVGARISCVVKPHRSDPNQHIDTVGGVLPDGNHWWRRLEDAIALVEHGHLFYVEQPGSGRVAVEVAESQHGHKYLRTVTDFDLHNNLLALPECAPNQLL